MNSNDIISISFSWRSLIALLVIAFQQANAFSVSVYLQHQLANLPTVESTSLPETATLEGRHFQLEELEESEASTTIVLLNPDHTITLGTTDGPLCLASSGIWTEVQDTVDGNKRYFEMKLARTFQTGHSGSTSTDIGEFEYSVERTYIGEITLVGGSLLAMNGQILDVDDIFGERRVGFFNMIDTTVEKNELGLL